MPTTSSFEWITDDSRKFLNAGYLTANETAEQRIHAIAVHAESILEIDGFADKFYDYMSKGWISLASPVWSNFGKKRGLPVSCFSSMVTDDVGGILFAQSEVGMMSKLGGGTSGYFGDIRPRGSDIRDNGKTSGAVHFMELFEKATDVISQGSTRRGRFAPYLPIDHGDIKEFLDIGTEGHPIQNLTTAVTVTDDWMKGMINGDLDKRRTWANVLQTRSEIGFPYVMYKDNANRNRPDVYKDKNMEIKGSNLCVAPETKILTDGGYIQIADLEDKEVVVWNGREWSNVLVKKTGTNQHLIRVVTSGGAEIECTPYHKFYVQNGYGKRNIVEKRANELVEGDKLIKFDSLPVIEGEEELDNAYANGFYSGDGCLTERGKRIYLYHEKRSHGIKSRLGDIFKNWTVQNNLNREYGHSDFLKDKFFVPMQEYTVKSRLDWLAGILDSDGTVAKTGKTQSLQIASTNKEFLEDMQMMLQTLGVNSTITFGRESGDYMLPSNNSSGENKLYSCKAIWRILIGQYDLEKLVDLGISFSRLNVDIDHRANRECNHFNKVVAVIDEGRYDDTFCFTEHKRGMGMFNGILTGQCSEIMLPLFDDESFVCVLSSLNMLYYDDWKDTDLVETMVYFLDAVITDFLRKLEAYRDSESRDDHLTFLFMERAYKFAKRHRALGLGVLGWHSYLQSKMIPFASKEANEINEECFERIQKQSYAASKKLAALFGEPVVLEGYGRRNTTLNAIAPTTSSAFILGQVSQSIEPLMSNYYIKDLAKLKAEIKNKYLESLLEEKGENTTEVWESIAIHDGSVQHLSFLTDHEREVFLTFKEIDPRAILDQAATRQKYLDQTQSLNLMIDNSYTVKDINKLMIEAWEKGICTLYYQHSVNSAQNFARNKQNAECEACSA